MLITNIDRLAAGGRRFTDAHSASAVCTPSRYGLLTGEYPVRRNIWGPAQLYDLDADVNQTRNLYKEYPEIVKEMSELLASYAPPKQKPGVRQGKPRAPGKPAKNSPATSSTR